MDNSELSDRLCDMDESDLSNIDMNMLEMDMSTTPSPMENQNENHYDYLDIMVCDEVLKSAMTMTQHEDSEPNFGTTELDLENCYEMNPDWLDIFDDPVLNDKMMTEATASPVVKSEHSYSVGNVMTSGAENTLVKSEPLSQHITLDEHTGPAINPKFLEVDSVDKRRHSNRLPPQISRPTIQTVTVTKQEPRIIVKNEPIIIEARRSTQQSLLKPSSILLTKHLPRVDQPSTTTVHSQRYEMTTHHMSDDLDEGIYLNVTPMTPPGSSSDSETGLSPSQSPTPSPIRQVIFKSSHREINPATAIYSQPIPTSGVLVLTEEEKRTLISEGYPIPSQLPLSKMEEKNLKKVRRKIKNKISAQESRRKRKEYMDHLEKKMEDISQENSDLRSRCDKFERSNQSLMTQLTNLQNVIKRVAPQHSVSQTSICLMVMILSFAIFFGDWLPSSMYVRSHDSTVHPQLSPSTHITNLDVYSSSHLGPSRTLLALSADERSCGNEPWPLLFARKSFESITYLMTPPEVMGGKSCVNASETSLIIAASYHKDSLEA